MNLANGDLNLFFTPPGGEKNRYYNEDFDAIGSPSQGNVLFLSEQIPAFSTVLDIGCGQGRFGRELEKKNCTAYGIEVDEEAAKYAQKTGCYKDIFIADVTHEDSSEYKRFLKTVTNIDVIIISDVLEHLVNPTISLLQFTQLLKENGIILISVPNIANMDIILNLINGKFNYSEMGILDNTHLKFFTKSSFVEWIHQINKVYSAISLDCEYLGATYYVSNFVSQVKNDYIELFDIFSSFQNHNVLQLLFKLTKLPNHEKLLKLPMLLQETENKGVDILGNALKGILEKNSIVEILAQNEKFITELESGIDWHNENKKRTEDLIKQKSEYIAKLESGIDWHNENKKKTEDLLKQKDEYIAKLESGIDWHNENKKRTEDLLKQKDDYIAKLVSGIR